MTLRIYIGHEERELDAYRVAEKSAREFGCDVQPLFEHKLRLQGLLTRPVDTRGSGWWDLHSSAPQSTAFANARFFVPLLAHSGWALFVDCDVVFMRDPDHLWQYADANKAVMVVKHNPQTFGPSVKMDGQVQTTYPRKLWSSVMLWNVDHPANNRLNLQMLNNWPGRDLHRFGWLAESEIGALPKEWNHLVGIDEPCDRPAIIHYTRGTPNLPGYEDCEYADVWRQYAHA